MIFLYAVDGPFAQKGFGPLIMPFFVLAGADLLLPMRSPDPGFYGAVELVARDFMAHPDREARQSLLFSGNERREG